MYLSEGLSAV